MDIDKDGTEVSSYSVDTDKVQDSDQSRVAQGDIDDSSSIQQQHSQVNQEEQEQEKGNQDMAEQEEEEEEEEKENNEWYTYQLFEYTPLAPGLLIKEGEVVYDMCWYPAMNSQDPGTCCVLSSSRDHPVHLWDAYTGM
ncbi:Telomerase Cajal body protein 1, partial [Modicella reniformis]